MNNTDKSRPAWLNSWLDYPHGSLDESRARELAWYAQAESEFAEQKALEGRGLVTLLRAHLSDAQWEAISKTDPVAAYRKFIADAEQKARECESFRRQLEAKDAEFLRAAMEYDELETERDQLAARLDEHCAACHGSGEVSVDRCEDTPDGNRVHVLGETCADCGGTGSKAARQLAALVAELEAKMSGGIYEFDGELLHGDGREVSDQPTKESRAEAIYCDSMVAHRWFEKHFGERFNGRDFALKCPMADEEILNLKDRAIVAEKMADDLAEALVPFDRASSRYESDPHKLIEGELFSCTAIFGEHLIVANRVRASYTKWKEGRDV